MKIDKAELLHIDCMEYMAGLPDKAFDLAIVDPPYGIGMDGRGTIEHSGWLQHKSKKWDGEVPQADYFCELRRVSMKQIIWGGNYFINNLSPSACWLIWDKMQEFDGAVFEMAWTSLSSPAKAFRMSRVEAYTKDAKIHPTQKPVKLYEWILASYGKLGQRILDTHLGSGSSAIACNNLGFEMVGCELDEDYYRAACQRVQKATEQMRLFA